MNHRAFTVGVGATDELGLRVSVAALMRVLFEHPEAGQLMLALERKATLRRTERENSVEVKAQPFGGALRIFDPRELQATVGRFHFDSERSRSEQDFRIFIKPSAWDAVRQFCLHHLSQAHDPVLESDPRRELTEEFAQALRVSLQPDQFVCQPVDSIIESAPSPTANVYAQGSSTVRIYRIFEVRILDRSLAQAMIVSSERYSDQSFRELALEDSRNGGRGWANGLLALSLNELREFYAATPFERRNHPTVFQKHRLDETVAALFEELRVPKYQRL